MPNLAVAHQALGESDSSRRSFNLGIALSRLGIGGLEAVHDRRVGGGNGVAFGGRVRARDAPAVDDDYGRLAVCCSFGELAAQWLTY
jgi:hypothetical protein